MKNFCTTLFFVIFLTCINCVNAQVIDTESSIVNFSANNVVFTKVSGSFAAIEGQANIVEGNLKDSFIDAKLYVQTLNTGNKKRDDHLKDEYYFNAAKYPNITFSSINIQRKYNSYIAKGELTIKDVTKWVSLPFRIEGIDNTKKRMIGKLQLKRKDFNLGSETSDLLISNKIEIEIDCVVKIDGDEIEDDNLPIKKGRQSCLK